MRAVAEPLAATPREVIAAYYAARFGARPLRQFHVYSRHRTARLALPGGAAVKARFPTAPLTMVRNHRLGSLRYRRSDGT